MEISKLSSAQLARLISLVKEKETAQAKLDRIEKALAALETGKSVATTGKRRGRKPGRPPGAKAKKASKVSAKKAGAPSRKRGKRLKGPLLKALKAAGAPGIKVSDLATKLKVKPGNIFSWFYTTGKKVKGISKVGEARYAYSA